MSNIDSMADTRGDLTMTLYSDYPTMKRSVVSVFSHRYRIGDIAEAVAEGRDIGRLDIWGHTCPLKPSDSKIRGLLGSGPWNVLQLARTLLRQRASACTCALYSISIETGRLRKPVELQVSTVKSVYGGKPALSWVQRLPDASVCIRTVFMPPNHVSAGNVKAYLHGMFK